MVMRSIVVCCVVAAQAAVVGAQEPRLRLSRDELNRVLSDTLDRARAAVITERGAEPPDVDRTGGLMLERGTFLAVRTPDTSHVVEDLVGPADTPDTAAIEPPGSEPFRNTAVPLHHARRRGRGHVGAAADRQGELAALA